MMERILIIVLIVPEFEAPGAQGLELETQLDIDPAIVGRRLLGRKTSGNSSGLQEERRSHHAHRSCVVHMIDQIACAD
jgi:hypothetical protein